MSPSLLLRATSARVCARAFSSVPQNLCTGRPAIYAATSRVPDASATLSLAGLCTKLNGGQPLELWRAPEAARFDAWFAATGTVEEVPPSRGLALGYSKRCLVAGYDICTDGILSGYKESWGGMSVFTSDNAFGKNALSYARMILSGVSGAACLFTTDPAGASCLDPSTRANVIFVHDRIIGRPPAMIDAVGITGASSDMVTIHGLADVRSTTNGSHALAHHVLMTVSAPTSTSEFDRMATCKGWAPAPPPMLGSSDPGAAGAAVFSSLIEEEANDPDVEDPTLSSVCDLLILLVPFGKGAGASGLNVALEALLYIYLFKHHQGFFGGRLDRVVSWDEGRCAELLLLAKASAFPSGDYAGNDWAHSTLTPIVEACHAFMLTPEIGASLTRAPRARLQVNCLKYVMQSPDRDSSGGIIMMPPMLNVPLAGKVRALVAAWPEADRGSLRVVACPGSVIVSGLLAWECGEPNPAPELVVDGQRLILVARGHAIGLAPNSASAPRQIAFSMRAVGASGSNSHGGDGGVFTHFAPASVRTLGALMPHAQPCIADGCAHLTLSSSGCEPRCWMHDGRIQLALK